jgi:hypothetical protein
MPNTSPASVKFVHLNVSTIHVDTWGKERIRNGATACYQEQETDGKKSLLVGVAICGENDSYNKRMGRMISEGRMRKYPYILADYDGEIPYEVVKEFLNELYFIDLADQQDLDEELKAEFELAPV